MNNKITIEKYNELSDIEKEFVSEPWSKERRANADSDLIALCDAFIERYRSTSFNSDLQLKITEEVRSFLDIAYSMNMNEVHDLCYSHLLNRYIDAASYIVERVKRYEDVGDDGHG